MKHYLPLTIALCLFLNACGGGNTRNTGLTPMPPEKRDPQNSLLISSINELLSRKGAPANSQYDFVRVDLNKDGLREGLVLFKTPYSYWCGWAGCGMAIFKAEDNSFSFISDMINVRGPIYIGPAYTNGYRDIVVRLSGTNMSDRNIMMKYNNQKYPKTPQSEPELPSYIDISPYTEYFR